MDLDLLDRTLREAVANIVRDNGGPLTVGGGNGHWDITWEVDGDTCIQVKYDLGKNTLSVYDISCGATTDACVQFYHDVPCITRLERAILTVI